MGNKGQTQTTTTSIPSWEQSDWNSLIGQANSQTNADINSVDYGKVGSQFQSGTQGILDQQVNPNSLNQQITGAANPAWTDSGTASSYMNPYEDTALQSQINVDRSSILNPSLAQVDRSAAASGALGGDRSAVEKANINNNFANTEANTVAQGENSAYNSGLSAFQADQARKLQGATAGTQTQLAGANSNIYSNFAAGQNNLNQIAASEAPGQQLASEAGILSALPKQGTQQTDTSPNGGMLGGILGGVLGGVGKLLKFKEGGIVDEGKGIMPPKKKRKK